FFQGTGRWSSSVYQCFKNGGDFSFYYPEYRPPHGSPNVDNGRWAVGQLWDTGCIEICLCFSELDKGKYLRRAIVDHPGFGKNHRDTKKADSFFDAKDGNPYQKHIRQLGQRTNPG